MLKGARKLDSGQSDVTLVGIPYDEGVSQKSGAALAPDRIRDISSTMPFVTEEGKSLRELNLRDYGNLTIPSKSPEFMFDYFRKFAVERFSESFLLTVGGDHSITGSIINALGDGGKGSKGIIYFDAHTDLSYEFDNFLYSHASALRRGMENKNLDPGNVLLVGVRSFEQEALKYLNETSIKYITASCVERCGTDKVSYSIIEHFRNVDDVYLSIDIDVLDPAFAPGTGVPDSGGMTSRQLFSIIESLWPLNLVGADLMEIAPPLDVNDITSIAGFKLLREILGIVLKRKSLNLRTDVLY